MTPIERDLEEIGRFIPGFFGLLGTIVAALPFVDKLFGAFPAVLHHQDVASILASIASFAIIGGHYVSKQGALIVETAYPTGLLLVAASVILTVGYIGIADFLNRTSIRTSVLGDGVLVLWYVAIYSTLTMGLWQMAWRAFKTKDKEISWGPFE